jgi:hypothetical protein
LKITPVEGENPAQPLSLGNAYQRRIQIHRQITVFAHQLSHTGDGVLWRKSHLPFFFNSILVIGRLFLHRFELDFSTTTLQRGVLFSIFDQKGLMGGVVLQDGRLPNSLPTDEECRVTGFLGFRYQIPTTKVFEQKQTDLTEGFLKISGSSVASCEEVAGDKA